jgi:hypothetical protein
MWSRAVLVVVVVAGLGAVASAQEPAVAAAQAPVVTAAPPSGPAAREAALRARYQLRVMEGVLQNAVQHGIRTVATEMRMVSPDVIFLGSPSRARGFRLEGYGVFFDVEVPTLRPSVAWSVRQLTQVAPEVSRALQSLRRAVASTGDVSTKREAEQALKLVELQVGPIGAPEDAAPGDEERRAPSPVQDPAEAYEREVMRALTEAVLDYGNTLSLSPDDWLGVAARANDTGLGESADAVTVLIKIRGRDLEALRTGALKREEARLRFVTTEF